MKIVADFFVSN